MRFFFDILWTSALTTWVYLQSYRIFGIRVIGKMKKYMCKKMSCRKWKKWVGKYRNRGKAKGETERRHEWASAPQSSSLSSFDFSSLTLPVGTRTHMSWSHIGKNKHQRTWDTGGRWEVHHSESALLTLLQGWGHRTTVIQWQSESIVLFFFLNKKFFLLNFD